MATLGNVTTAGAATNGGGTVSFNHTSNSNTLVVHVGSADGSGGVVPTSVTAAGVNMTQVFGIISGAQFASSAWILTGVATTGTLAIVISWGTTAQNAGMAYASESWIGVNQSTPNGTAVTAFSTTTTTPAVTANDTTGQVCVATAMTFSTALAAGGGQTNDALQQNLAAFTSFSADHATAAGATTAFSWTESGSTSAGWTAGAFNLIDAAATGTVIAWMHV
jgi:hypothetical protein